MQEGIKTFHKLRPPQTRNNSESTENSSIAEADIIRQYDSLRNQIILNPAVLPSISTNVSITSSDNIKIICHNCEKTNRKNSIISILSENFEKIKEKICCWKLNKNRKKILIRVLLHVLLITAIISITTFHLINNYQTGDDSETTPVSEQITTSTVMPIDKICHKGEQETKIEPLNSVERKIEGNLIEAFVNEEGANTDKPALSEYFITRNEWGASPPKAFIKFLKTPIKRIIIGHTGGEFCTDETNCKEVVKSIQFQDSSHVDIPYNFLIGGDGKVYEGRGFNYTGQHTQNKDATEYNSIGICIAIIGNYHSTQPSSEQINKLKAFINHFIGESLIAQDHIIVSQDDLKYSSKRAHALNNVVKFLKNYRPLYKIHRREEWKAKDRKGDKEFFNRTMDWILIDHTVTFLCSDLNSCMARARSLQEDSFSRSLDDISYNIFFGGDGFAFEGRGWDIRAAHANNFNDRTIGVGVIGDFSSIPPNNNIINAMLQVFEDARVLGKLTEDYTINGRSDFGDPGPGEAFMEIIKTWCRHGNKPVS